MAVDKYNAERNLEHNTLIIKRLKYAILANFIGEILLVFAFKIFVLNRGNLFDYITSIVVLVAVFVLLSTLVTWLMKEFKNRKVCQRDYTLAFETSEEKLNRERKEKFSRILKT